ncbi:MAG: glycosyltransferase family 2 protein [Okeania sp. SIO3I5]|uniref:glycosyltransferase n=1 Tax=Okeania sp. SIO3I5 TaxID=2607805 RepID=UPI0013B973CE|nr:glycosyltransferase family 2 protein [Okeania sp. SIO3I5]NEQ34995.1 glycosyltransferase family 2 protein [Okeania sp. SIO3I5]
MPDSSWPKNDYYEETKIYQNYTSDNENQNARIVKKQESSDANQIKQGTEVVETTKFTNQNIYDGRGRRCKAAFMLSLIWTTTIILHLLSWGYWIILGLTGLLSVQFLRILFAKPKSAPKPLSEENLAEWPYISLLVAAKNEEAVISKLVKNICALDYPTNNYELWVIDDNSTDKTPLLLEQLAREYQQLKVITRGPDAGGGKSGALNTAIPFVRGEILGVFDADAQVTPDLLRKVVPLFAREEVGAVQLRKAIANAGLNFWTKGQSAEMVVDGFFQEQRIAIGGIGELRGNGQFVRLNALEECGGWNEETITDDLDLTIRLHLNQWDIDFLAFPAVMEEGVTNPIALWHQRSRWAEGGYQRYLDYWKLILRNRMRFGKTWDLWQFLVTQYLLSVAAVPDFLMSIILRRLPITSPLAVFTVMVSLLGMFIGLRRTRKGQMSLANEEKVTELAPRKEHSLSLLLTFLESVRGTFYMLHWFLVMGVTIPRMSVLPKRLKWVKTVHTGDGES